MINGEKKILGRHIECKYTTQQKISIAASDVEKKIENCSKLYTKTNEPFFNQVEKVLIVIAYKKWKQFDESKIPKDWKVFVITKEFFTKLYGPTLINLAQYYEGPDENEK